MLKSPVLPSMLKVDSLLGGISFQVAKNTWRSIRPSAPNKISIGIELAK